LNYKEGDGGMKDKEREKGALFMIGEKEGAWLMCHWVGGEPD